MIGFPSRSSLHSSSSSFLVPSSLASRRFLFVIFSLTALTGLSALLLVSTPSTFGSTLFHFGSSSRLFTTPLYSFAYAEPTSVPSMEVNVDIKGDVAVDRDSKSSSSTSTSFPPRSPLTKPPPIEELGYHITKTFIHDKEPFTQGLSFWQDQTTNQKHLFEGTGMYGESVLRHIDAKTGEEKSSVNLNRKFFGEGITIIPLPLTTTSSTSNIEKELTNHKDDKRQNMEANNNQEEKLAIIQLTWREQTAFIWEVSYSTTLSTTSPSKFKMIKTVPFTTFRNEGWGITYYPERNELVVSDGSDYLFFWDPVTLEEKKRIKVKGLGLKSKNKISSLKLLNELEYINGKIWANVWFSDIIYEIDPETGFVTRSVDFSKLFPKHKRENQDQVLNGIAYDEKEDLFYITGKWWPSIFEIKLCSNAQTDQVTQDGETKGSQKRIQTHMMTCPSISD